MFSLSTSKSEYQVKSGFFLDVVVRKCSSIFKLLSSEDKSLLVWGNTFLVLDLSFDILNGVRLFNFKGDSFTSQGLDEDLHSTSESEDKMKSRFFLDVVVSKSSTVFKLFSSEDKSLLIWRDSFLVLDLGFDIFNGIRLLNFKRDGFTSQGLDEDLHSTS